MEYFMEVTKKDKMENVLKQLNQRSLFIYSPTSLRKIQQIEVYANCFNWHDVTKNQDDLERFITALPEIDTVVSLGGGSAIDIAKYVSFRLNKKHICIPSMLSTNSYATNKVALLVNGMKTTVDAKMPDEIILDHDLLCKSAEENLFGFADVLSIYTALYDWEIACEKNHEVIDQKVYDMAKELLEDVKLHIQQNSYEMIESDVEKLYQYVGIAGYITNIYGCGRPESGSEHIYAKQLEGIINIPHGLAVSTGIILMTMLQKRNVDEIVELIRKIRVLDYAQKYHLTLKEVREALMNMKPRIDRFSVVDIQNSNEELKEKIMEDFIKKELIEKV